MPVSESIRPKGVRLDAANGFGSSVETLNNFWSRQSNISSPATLCACAAKLTGYATHREGNRSLQTISGCERAPEGGFIPQNEAFSNTKKQAQNAQMHAPEGRRQIRREFRRISDLLASWNSASGNHRSKSGLRLALLGNEWCGSQWA